jgi:alginate O-acetyltransferase complex protein AlgJ
MTTTPRKSGPLADVGVVALFLGIICLPALRNFFGHPAAATAENRTLAARPPWKLSRNFPGEFEAFYNDHFGFRQRLVSWLGVAHVKWLKISSSPNVVLGNDGLLFYTPLPVGMNYPEGDRFTADQVACWGHLLHARRDWLAARGIRYLFVIAPDKQSVYPEALPRKLKHCLPGRARLDQLLAYLRADPDFPVLDLREPLWDAKAEGRLYFATDSHWNVRGAYHAYARIVAVLSRYYAEMKAPPWAAFHEVFDRQIAGDCTRLLGLADCLGEVAQRLEPWAPAHARQVDVAGKFPGNPACRPFAMERPDLPAPRAVMFHDSFGAYLVPTLAEHFRRIVFAWERADYPIFDTGLIEREHPDLVIQEMIERKLLLYLPEHGPALGDACGETPAAWSGCSTRAE